MLRYTMRRLTWLPIILFGVSLIVFVMLRVAPGQNPAETIAGQGATPAQIDRLEKQFGLDKPIAEQYVVWLGDLVRGDFGDEFYSQKSIRDEFIRRSPPSFQIVAMSLAVGAFVGITFGVISAIFRNRWPDYSVRFGAVAAASVPEFFLLTLLIVLPAYFWSYSQPVGGYVPIYEDPYENLRLMLPPALIVGVAGSAGLMRLTRTTMLEVLRSDYVRTARAKGLRSRTVIVAHALRNAGTPIITALGTAFIAVFSGSVIAERVLSIDGLGFWFFSAAGLRDLTVIQFLAVYTAFVVIIVNLLVDLSYALIDPRVRYS
ncbi:MAG TPA: ABC transporter permease [Dehalococcoidia bacterium]|nr:ABC transporter permease [Dehalococcoidia bacterium]